MATTIDRFQKNFLAFLDLFIYYLHEGRNKKLECLDPTVFQLVKNFASGQDKSAIMEHFIDNTYPYLKLIHHKDETFFLNHAKELFSVFSEKDIDKFIVLFKAKTDGRSFFTAEDHESIWNYIHSLVRQSIKYIHERREPATREVNGVIQKGYRVKYRSDIDVHTLSRDWNLELIY